MKQVSASSNDRVKVISGWMIYHDRNAMKRHIFLKKSLIANFLTTDVAQLVYRYECALAHATLDRIYTSKLLYW